VWPCHATLCIALYLFDLCSNSLHIFLQNKSFIFKFYCFLASWEEELSITFNDKILQFCCLLDSCSIYEYMKSDNREGFASLTVNNELIDYFKGFLNYIWVQRYFYALHAIVWVHIVFRFEHSFVCWTVRPAALCECNSSAVIDPKAFIFS
jgi:hypothetical protein